MVILLQPKKLYLKIISLRQIVRMERGEHLLVLYEQNTSAFVTFSLVCYTFTNMLVALLVSSRSCLYFNLFLSFSIFTRYSTFCFFPVRFKRCRHVKFLSCAAPFFQPSSQTLVFIIVQDVAALSFFKCPSCVSQVREACRCPEVFW